MSGRYQTIDITSGEIIKDTNRHPMLEPLRPRSSSRTGLYIKTRPSTHRNELEAVVCMLMACIAFALWTWALR